mgnify:FL=1
MQKVLAVIISQYQLELFLQANANCKLDQVYYITSRFLVDRIKVFAASSSILIFDDKPSKISFIKARREINGIKRFIKDKGISEDDLLWIANDEHQIDQCVYNLVGFKHVNMLEDGLGSYIKHKLFKYDNGFIFIAKKVKQIVNYFPYYRAFYGCGCNIKASQIYSYQAAAFPMQNTPVRYIFEKKYEAPKCDVLAPAGSVIFIGQPLIQGGYLTETEYIRYIKYVRDILEPGGNIIYRAHPLEKKLNYLEGLGVTIMKSDFVPVESYIYYSGSGLSVYSFLSTSLLHIKKFKNVDKLISLKPSNKKKLEPYYSFLHDFGVEVVCV